MVNSYKKLYLQRYSYLELHRKSLNNEVGIYKLELNQALSTVLLVPHVVRQPEDILLCFQYPERVRFCFLSLATWIYLNIERRIEDFSKVHSCKESVAFGYM